jgi:hypothetical protein
MLAKDSRALILKERRTKDVQIGYDVSIVEET